MKWLRKSAELRLREKSKRIAELRRPRRYFAWHPVRLEGKTPDAKLQYVWLEFVWQKRLFYDDGESMWNEYSLKKPKAQT